MKKNTMDYKIKIQYKNDEESKNKLIEFLIDCLIDFKKGVGDNNGKC